MEAILEEYDPKLEYIQGETNFIADIFSWMGIFDDTEPLVGKNNAPTSDIKYEFNFLSTLEDQYFLDCYATLIDYNINVLTLSKNMIAS